MSDLVKRLTATCGGCDWSLATDSLLLASGSLSGAPQLLDTLTLSELHLRPFLPL